MPALSKHDMPFVYAQAAPTPKSAGLWGPSSFGNLLSKTFNDLLGPEDSAEGAGVSRRCALIMCIGLVLRHALLCTRACLCLIRCHRR